MLCAFLGISPQTASGQMPGGWEAPLPSGPLNDDYELTPDSQRQEGVPQGKVFGIPMDDSKIYPGTKRHISVYVPAQYDASKPACVYVGLDGLGFHAPTVFDNLIHKGEIPVLIGIGISPGTAPSNDGGENPRFNRSCEFDGLSDNLCRFLLDEVFPLVESTKTPDGLEIRLSKDPNDRAAGGASTGGIGAFTLAWERPDQFRRVFSAIGTFVGMRGGDRYPVLVRKTEPKPIRVFMQDGHHDQWLGGPEVGDWWIGNVALQRALEFSGYDVKHVWGTGPHSGRQADQVFPEAQRWLWRDRPEPVAAGAEKTLNVFLKQILEPEQDWIEVESGLAEPRELAADSRGVVFCRDAATKTIYRLTEDGEAKRSSAQPGDGGPFTFTKDGTLLGAEMAAGKVLVGRPAAWTSGQIDLSASKLFPTSDGGYYASDAVKNVVWHVTESGERRIVADETEGLVAPTGIAVTPDGLWLAVIESRSHWGRSYRIEADGTLTRGQRFYWFHVPDGADDLGAGDCRFDLDGRLYIATRLGVAVLDRNGRTRAILPSPVRGGQGEVSALCFGGKDGRTLYIVVENRIFKRTLKSRGAGPTAQPAKLPGWGAG